MAGCRQSSTEEIERLSSQLRVAELKLAEIQAWQQTPQLVHLVWLDIKDGASEDELQQLIDALKKLAAIDVVRDLEVGQFADLGDSRAIPGYELFMQMSFEKEEDYRTYQEHAIHQQLKENIADQLARTPATYDYWSK